MLLTGPSRDGSRRFRESLSTYCIAVLIILISIYIYRTSYYSPHVRQPSKQVEPVSFCSLNMLIQREYILFCFMLYLDCSAGGLVL